MYARRYSCAYTLTRYLRYNKNKQKSDHVKHGQDPGIYNRIEIKTENPESTK